MTFFLIYISYVITDFDTLIIKQRILLIIIYILTYIILYTKYTKSIGKIKY